MKQKTYNGRKYRMAILCLIFILAAYGLATINPILANIFDTVVSGIVGILIVYAGGNVGASAVYNFKTKNNSIETENL